MNLKVFWSRAMFISVVAWAGLCWPCHAQQDPESEAATSRLPQLRIEVSAELFKCVQGMEPIDVVRLAFMIESLPAVFDGREQVIQDLGKLLIFDGRIDFAEGAPITGLPPEDVLKSVALRALARFGDSAASPFLEEFYASGGGNRFPALAETITSLGGVVPPVRPPKEAETDVIWREALEAQIAVAAARSAATEESVDIGNLVKEVAALPKTFEDRERLVRALRKVQRAEIGKLAADMGRAGISDGDLGRLIRQVGRAGQEGDAHLVLERLGAANLRWIVRQNALEALGRLGGDDARAFLIGELQKPMPSVSDLSDYGSIEAILRSQAALALGKCGDDSVLGILREVAGDKTQFARVRESCRTAIRLIQQRSGKRRNRHQDGREPAGS